jgi:hypothetical protein
MRRPTGMILIFEVFTYDKLINRIEIAAKMANLDQKSKRKPKGAVLAVKYHHDLLLMLSI